MPGLQGGMRRFAFDFLDAQNLACMKWSREPKISHKTLGSVAFPPLLHTFPGKPGQAEGAIETMPCISCIFDL